MKEILYIQAGSLANFTGTHFWNAQESYLTYDEGDDRFVDHDRSFREGMTSKVMTLTKLPYTQVPNVHSRGSQHTAQDLFSTIENVCDWSTNITLCSCDFSKFRCFVRHSLSGWRERKRDTTMVS